MNSYPFSPSMRLGFLIAYLLFQCRLAGIPLDSAAQDLVHDSWSTRDGLPVSQVSMVIQSKSGYLWCATEEGPVRFDGKQFKQYTRSTNPGLSSSMTIALCEDESGGLWFATSLGVVRFGDDGKFWSIALEGQENLDINCLGPDDKGGVWIGTAKGVFHATKSERQATYVSSLGIHEIRTLARDRMGGVWVGTLDGLFHLLADGSVEHVAIADLGGSLVYTYPDRDGQLLIAGNGLHALKSGERQARVLPGTESLHIVEVFRDRGGTLWIGTRSGIYRMLEGKAQLIESTKTLDITSITDDTDGSLWFGTANMGLHRLRRGPIITYDKAKGLASDVTNAVLSTPEGVVWIASNSGLDRLENGEITHESLPVASPIRIRSLHRDAQGRLWVGSSGKVFLKEGDTWKTFGPLPNAITAAVRSIATDKKGNVWIGTSVGLYRLEEGKFVICLNEDGTNTDRLISMIAVAPDDTVWVCGKGGLGRIESGYHRMIYDQVPCVGVNIQKDGTVWAGLFGEGLLRLRDGRRSFFTPREGIPQETIFSVLDDGKDTLLMTGNHGILKASIAE